MLVRFVVSRFGLELIAYESPDIPLNVDPDLLSGMLQAMETIGVELKNPIQEIKFSNWVIYVRPYPEYTIRLILADHITKEKADAIFGDLNIQVQGHLSEIEKGRTLPEEEIKSDFLPYLKSLILDRSSKTDEESAPVEMALQSEKSELVSKVIMAGLGAVGKTSIRKLFLDHVSPSEAAATKPTLGVEISKKELEYLNGALNVHEFGGQDLFRTRYLTNRSLWVGTIALIFVVDLQKPEVFVESRNYLRSVWNILTQTNSRLPALSIFIHKYDPSKRKEVAPTLRMCLETFVEFNDVATFHLTSIEDKSSNVAIIKTIYLSLPSVIMENILNDDLYHDLLQNLFPKLTPLISDDATGIDDDLKMEIRSSAALFGRGYGNKLQKLWIKYMGGDVSEKRKEIKASASVLVTKAGKELIVKLKKDPMFPNLSGIVFDGVLTGITKSLQFSPPKFIDDTTDFFTYKIGV
jgi:hypothetical protein